MHLLNDLKWRYATKHFDSSKKVSPENLSKLKQAIQLSVSSYGLQPYKVLIIENKEIRKQLQAASWGQNQIIDASHLLVFCNYNSVNNKHVEDYIKLASKLQESNIDSLNNYGDFIKQKISEISPKENYHWAYRQTYLALSNLINACAALKIDACPMEGFENEKYNDILDLSKANLNAAVIATIGYRSEKDKAQYRQKVRKPFNQLFEVI
ncbi:NAD(P)H-dependent oxidoreductase [Aquimarina sediminis]|uniref:NAD(P)H-dependent oxidoreductase n=1 Tax=Aquimarina sediminis TaxID=2070536 RepID=UPI000CA08E9D|nr:NAD(P)H-dependent oxidoreductase [Aquimarina sediminis]